MVTAAVAVTATVTVNVDVKVNVKECGRVVKPINPRAESVRFGLLTAMVVITHPHQRLRRPRSKQLAAS